MHGSSAEWSQDAQDPSKHMRTPRGPPTPINPAPSPPPEPAREPMPFPKPPLPVPKAYAPGPAAQPARESPTLLSAAKSSQPSKSALDKRIRRALEPDAKGQYKVCQEIRDQWSSNRDAVFKLFAECGNDADPSLQFACISFWVISSYKCACIHVDRCGCIGLRRHLYVVSLSRRPKRKRWNSKSTSYSSRRMKWSRPPTTCPSYLVDLGFVYKCMNLEACSAKGGH